MSDPRHEEAWAVLVAFLVYGGTVVIYLSVVLDPETNWRELGLVLVTYEAASRAVEVWRDARRRKQ